jgi:hypothetical protein
MQEVEDEPLFCERAAGIDIGKAVVMVTIRVPGETRKGGRQQETREFGTTRRQLLALADWLRCWGVAKAGMESTSVIRGADGMNRTLPRSCRRGRVRDGKDKSGNDERWRRDGRRSRLSASRTVPG